MYLKNIRLTFKERDGYELLLKSIIFCKTLIFCKYLVMALPYFIVYVMQQYEINIQKKRRL